MRVDEHDDTAAFLATVEPLLRRDEVRHNLVLGILRTLVRHPERCPERRLWLVSDAGGPVAMALRTPPHQLALAAPDDDGAATALAETLATSEPELPGVVGALPEVDRFAAAYAAATGRRTGARMDQGIHSLTEVTDVPEPSGAPRPAEPRDADLLIDWLRDFMAEADPHAPWDEEGTRKRLEVRVAGEDEAGLWVWDDDGPACLCGWVGTTTEIARVGPVYTPPDRRRRGYGTALVAARSRDLLAGGRRFCCLYTDLANPTSNAIYARIGYRLVCESAQIAFETTDTR